MKPSYYHNTSMKTAAAGRSAAWHSAYPRPAFRRAEETCHILTDWHLSCLDETTDTVTPLGPIRLPFPPESPLSGIAQTLEEHEAWLYETVFTLANDAPTASCTLLHLPPADQMCIVTLNGHTFGERITANLPTDYDLTAHLLPGENRLTVLVRDPLDTNIPYGKQSRKRGGMWYTPTSGMRGMPWLETVPAAYIRGLRITPTLDSVTLETDGCETMTKTVRYETENGAETVSFSGDRVTIHIKDPHLWSPDDPYVYRFTIRSGDDEVSSYFALRTVSAETVTAETVTAETVTAETVNGSPVLCLNGKPHYFHGLLDQGYDPDGIDLPACPDGYRRDIEAAKSLGFDTLRKHIRIDDPYFYYFCDMLGMCVFQDFVNNGTYSFLRDTALPTVGLRRGIRRHAPDAQKKHFTDTADRTVTLLYNHPSVVYYTIFNEGWGQFDPDTLYRRYRDMDSTRIWDATSGWFLEKESDVTSEHIYFKPLKLKAIPDRPLVLSEFGGYVCKLPEHSFNQDKTYGYKIFTDIQSFRDGLEKLYRDEVIPSIENGLNAAVLTQVSDVEDETNGLVTYDRQVIKADEEAMRSIAQDLQEAFSRKVHS